MIDFREHWDFDDPITSEARFRALLDTLEGEEWSQCMTQLARSLGLQKRFDEARNLLQEFNLFIDFDAPNRTAAYWSLEMGRILRSSGNPSESKKYFEDAARMAAHDLDLEIDAIHMLAIVAEPDEALKLNKRAIELARSTQDPKARRWLGSLLNNAGWSLMDLQRPQEALEVFIEALTEREAAGTESEVAIAKWCVARALRELGEHHRAIEILREILSQGVDKSGFTHEELALNYAATNEPELSESFAKEAAALLSKG